MKDWSLKWMFICLLCLLPLAMYLHLIAGQIEISFSSYFDSIMNFDSKNTSQVLVREFRVPRLFMAMMAGAGLSLSGMFMQTLFKNPLAGPYVLGINSGASLLIALSLMTGVQFFQSNFGLIGTALIGAFAAGLLMMLIAQRLKSQITLLLVGLMFGSFTSAIVSILESFAGAESLKSYTMWSMGSLQQVEFGQLGIILLIFTLGIIASFLLVKPLNMLVIGEKSAALLGLPIKSTRKFVLLLTALFAGLITAFCGPIAFVGIAIPNLTRILFQTTNHRYLIIGNMLIGAIFLLLTDSFIQLLEGHLSIPLNALTSIIGAPFVVFLLIRKLK
ncbi:MAG: iron ABC transporter permease [Crocinitomicaceae bacterium]|nr:iron ABC transporter permease [Crocinitomicaceae bacterium]MBP6032170.1 iron ABC transporter permease [Crocinitomicaceae bacterium]